MKLSPFIQVYTHQKWQMITQIWNIFFNNLKTPSITTTHRTRTELPLNLTEIIDAIKVMQIGKTPGPDGAPENSFFNKVLQ